MLVDNYGLMQLSLVGAVEEDRLRGRANGSFRGPSSLKRWPLPFPVPSSDLPHGAAVSRPSISSGSRALIEAP